MQEDGNAMEIRSSTNRGVVLNPVDQEGSLYGKSIPSAGNGDGAYNEVVEGSPSKLDAVILSIGSLLSSWKDVCS